VVTRRQFLRYLTLLGVGTAAGAGLAGCGPEPTPVLQRVPTTAPTLTPPPPAISTATSLPARSPTATPAPSTTPAAGQSYVVVARGDNPTEITRRAIAALGGMAQFVKPGANVIIKPNICNAYHGPEYASTTNPEVVAALVVLCKEAGAKRVRVMDAPFGGTPQASYTRSGIEEAVKKAGGEMEVMARMKFRDLEIPRGKAIKTWPVYGDILDADLVINVPIAKTHGNTRLTLGMKNLMGVIDNRNGFHARSLHQCIADLNSAVRPQLTLIDAVRILTANGPTGGNLNDVKRLDTVIASTDVVAADAYATTLFGMTPGQIGYIQLGAELGLGQMDLKKIKIEEIKV